MINDNYTKTEDYSSASNEQIVRFVDQVKPICYNLEKFLSRNYPFVYYEVLKRTSFLNDHYESKGKTVPIKCRLYCMMHNIIEHPKCQCHDCDNTVNWNGSEFSRFCSNRCINHSGEVVQKMKNAWMKKDGQEIDKIKMKSKMTCNTRYGVDFPMQSAAIQQKVKETVVKKFGVEHISQSNEIKERKKQCYQKKYGVDCVLQSDEVKQQIKETCIRKYRVEHIMQNEDIKMKSRCTHQTRYGGIGFASEELANKTKQTIMAEYGVDSASKSEEVKRRIREAMQQKYGVDYYSQTMEFHQKSSKRYVSPKYPDMTFATSWEFIVYDFLTENNISFEYQVEPIPYEYDGKVHYYIPDFKVGGRIYEVKGDHFFRINESSGQEEMYCPYSYTEWTDKYYEWKCGLYEAKHQCMLNNGVVILRHEQVQNLTVEMFVQLYKND